MSTERDELRSTVATVLLSRGSLHPVLNPIDAVTDAILAAGYRRPREVTTAAELDALPVGSVVVDRIGGAWVKVSDGTVDWWVCPDGISSESKSSQGVAALFGPATVLHEPEGER